MRHEMFDYATKLLNMTTTTAQPAINEPHSSKDTAAAAIESPANAETASTTMPTIDYFKHLDSFNSSVKEFFNKTVAQVAKANLSDYTTTPYSLAPSNGSSIVAGGSASGGGAGFSVGVAEAVTTTLPVPTTRHIETSSFPAQTVATFIAGNKNRATTIIVYPTVSPESIVIPIVSCIFGFPILALIVICCLRRRAKLARERDRRRNYDMQDHAVSLVRFSPIHRLNYRSSRAISLRPERSLSQGFTSLELDTVLEERCSDVEQTQIELLNAESPMESSSYKMSLSS